MSKTVPYRSLRRQPGAWRGNRLGQRWLGLVVRPRLALRRRNGGFSLMVIFLLVLSILTTTLALTSRTIAGLYAQSYQSKLRLAKDAAENGLVVVASEFNYPGNRRVIGDYDFGINRLGNVNPRAVTWDSNLIDDTPPGDLSKPCFVYRGGGAIRQKTAGTPDTSNDIIYKSSAVPNRGNQDIFDGGRYNDKHTSWFASIAQGQDNDFHYLGNNQFYRPIALRLYNSDHTIADIAVENDVSYLTVAVEGFYAPRQTLNKKRGDIIAYASVINDKNSVKYTLQQEFQVVPRCCSQGFGEVNGKSYGPSSAVSNQCSATTPNTTTEWILRSVSRTSAFNSAP